jgi:hypothetical protein
MQRNRVLIDTEIAKDITEQELIDVGFTFLVSVDHKVWRFFESSTQPKYIKKLIEGKYSDSNGEHNGNTASYNIYSIKDMHKFPLLRVKYGF